MPRRKTYKYRELTKEEIQTIDSAVQTLKNTNAYCIYLSPYFYVVRDVYMNELTRGTYHGQNDSPNISQKT